MIKERDLTRKTGKNDQLCVNRKYRVEVVVKNLFGKD